MTLFCPILMKRTVSPNELRVLFTKYSCSFFSEFLPPRNLEECHNLIRRLKDENEALKVELMPRTLNECHDLIRQLTAEKDSMAAEYEALYEKFNQLNVSQAEASQEIPSAPTDQTLSNSPFKEALIKLKIYTQITLSLSLGLYLGSYIH